ncbi:MAG TPA: Fe-S cluster assembly protein SufD [Stellaceae bacterium]|nr:Fe-S cluster assembly protein SufD [Stellaceae bacterium]
MISLATRPATPLLETAASQPLAGGPAWLGTIRDAARQRALDTGLPTRRHEAWRFTDLKALADTRFVPAVDEAGEALDQRLAEGLGTDGAVDLLVFVNGCYSASRSSIGALPKGAFLGGFAGLAASDPAAVRGIFEADTEERPVADQSFVALNTAFFADGLALVLEPGVRLERPIHVLHWGEASDPAASHTRSLIRLGAGAVATLIESFAGTGAYWTNGATTIELGAEADLNHVRLQDDAAQAFHTASTAIGIGAKARYDAVSLTLGAALSRHDIHATIDGERAFCGVSGAYLLAGRQEATIATLIEHKAPWGETKEIFKGVVAERGHGVFQGKIKVHRAGQKTDAYQLSKTVLLGERAVMDAKPELEIYADDVKCSHGATVGDLDETALFYLRSRGIEPLAARRMLIEAFVIDAVDLVRDPMARSYLVDRIGRWLARQKD